jgi:hypothetical protein
MMYTLTPEPENGLGLGSLRYSILYLTVQGGNLNLVTQRRLNKAYGHVIYDGVALSFKEGVGRYLYCNKQVAGGAAVAAVMAGTPDRYGLSVVYAGRYIYAYAGIPSYIPLTLTLAAGGCVLSYLAATVGTGRCRGYHTKGRSC